MGKRAAPPPPREHTSLVPWRFHVCCWVEIEHGSETLVGAINLRPVYNTCFCFSCQYFHPSSNSRWLRVSRVWWTCSIHLLFAADQAGILFAACGAVGWICVAQPLQVSSNFWWGVSGRDTGVGSSQQDWEFVLEAGVRTWCPQVLGGIYDLCSVDCSCSIKDSTGVKLFLSGDHHRRRWPCTTASVESTARWSFGARMGQGQWDRGLPVGIPVFRPGATTAGAVFNEEPP